MNLSLWRIFIREYAEIISTDQKVKTFDFSINIFFMHLYYSQKPEISSLLLKHINEKDVNYVISIHELHNFYSKKLNKQIQCECNDQEVRNTSSCYLVTDSYLTRGVEWWQLYGVKGGCLLYNCYLLISLLSATLIDCAEHTIYDYPGLSSN